MPSGASPDLQPRLAHAADAFQLDPQAYLNADARDTTAANGKVSFTIEQAATQLLRGEPGWGSMGQPFTVTYAYRANAPLTMPTDTGGFSRFNAAQINQAELAFTAWSDVANIRFSRVGFGNSGEGAYSNNATILLGDYASGVDGASAFSFYPGSTSVTSSAGDVWVNSTFAYNTNPSVGAYGGMVLVHEIGHTIGLAHPSDYNADDNASPNYATDASYYEDDRQYTVMSYFPETNTGATFGGVYSAAPLLDDIAAAQMAYGANMATRAGDTVYGFGATADRPWFVATSSASKLVFAVWDAGGTDTFNFSGYGFNQQIDLRPGFFSNVGGLVGNVAVAANVVIENAVGGFGADVIHGNDAGNTIDGGPGNDSLDGGAGGSNRLFGGDGNDVIVGGADFDAVNGNKGEDIIDGGAGGNDWLLGGQGDDQIVAHAGNVILNGNIGADAVYGGGGADLVRGGQGNDLLNGGGGDDQIFGDLGDDTMTGGAGADIFHFALGGGVDVVTDFNAAEGDRIQLDGAPTYAVAQSGANTVISVGAGADQLVLIGVQATTLGPGSILLA